jgi:hypothetical protein
VDGDGAAARIIDNRFVLILNCSSGGVVPERFDQLIESVVRDGTDHHHDAMPADFGPMSGRLEMFIRCLEVVSKRYPDIRIRLSGERSALMDLGLVPDGEFLVGKRLYRAHVTPPGPLPGAVRLTFSRYP